MDNFIAHAAEVVAKFYMKLWSTAVSTVKSAVAVVKKAVSEAVDWIKREVRGAIDGFIRDIKERIDGWYEGIVDVIKKIARARSDEEAMALGVELFEATFGAILPYIMGVTIAIEAVIIMIEGVSGGLATIAMPAIAMIVVTVFINNLKISEGKSPISSSLSFKGLADWIGGKVKEKYVDEKVNWERTLISVVMGGIATVLSLTGFMISWGLNAITEKYQGYSDKTVREFVGEGASASAILLGIFSLILSASTANDKLVSPSTRAILDFWSGMISVIGIIFSLVGLGANPTLWPLDTLAILFSLGALMIPGVM